MADSGAGRADHSKDTVRWDGGRRRRRAQFLKKRKATEGSEMDKKSQIENKLSAKGSLTLPALPDFRYLPAPALTPQPGCPWAETMVLNPAIVKDPDSNALHMLFRASGPYPGEKARPDCVEPYPIFLGYARSDDLGRTWAADFSRPALAPALEYEMDRIYAVDDEGRRVVNYANGCIEDPRIFIIEGVW